MGLARRRLATAALAATVAVVGAACTLLIDLDGYEGQAAQTPDASGDVVEGEQTKDAGTDARIECIAPSFCDDFDELPLGARWSSLYTAGGAVMQLDDAGRVSAPYAIRVEIPAADASLDRVAILRRDMGSGKRLQCSFQLRLEPGATAIVFGIESNAPSGTHGVRFAAQADDTALYGGWYLADGGGGTNYSNTGALPRGSWVNITVDTDFATAKVSFDGAQRISLPMISHEPTTIRIELGGALQGASASSALRIDSLRCDLTK